MTTCEQLYGTPYADSGETQEQRLAYLSALAQAATPEVFTHYDDEATSKQQTAHTD
jgi:hypothetical protein